MYRLRLASSVLSVATVVPHHGSQAEKCFQHIDMQPISELLHISTVKALARAWLTKVEQAAAAECLPATGAAMWNITGAQG